jgi:hypothetical protein
MHHAHLFLQGHLGQEILDARVQGRAGRLGLAWGRAGEPRAGGSGKQRRKDQVTGAEALFRFHKLMECFCFSCAPEPSSRRPLVPSRQARSPIFGGMTSLFFTRRLCLFHPAESSPK